MSDTLDALAALSRLTDNQREAWVNRTLLGWTDARTARSMGVSTITVYRWLNRADRALGIEHEPRRRHIRGICSGCGIPTNGDDYTAGCDPCKSRRCDRRRKGRYAAKACGGCNGPLDQYTSGCETCSHRRWRRQRTAADRAA